MAAASISRSNFEKIIDSTFSKLRRSASPAFRKLENAFPLEMDFVLDLTMCLADFTRVNGSTIQY